MSLKYPTALLVLSLLLPGTSAQDPGQKDRSYSDYLTSRVKQLTCRFIPRKINGYPPEQKWEITHLSSADQQKLKITKNHSGYQLFLPADFNSWAFRPENALMITNSAIAARTGKSELIREPWLAAAIVHKIYEPGILYGFSGYGDYPYARAMLAYGIAPSPAAIITTPFSAFLNSFTSANTIEWCSLLLEFFHSKQNKGALEYYLCSDQKESADQRLISILSPSEQKQKNSILTKDISPEQKFKDYTVAQILGRSTPAAVPWIEKQFRQIAGNMSDFIEKTADQPLTEQQRTLLTESAMQVQRLAILAPETVSLKLFSYAETLLKMRNQSNLDPMKLPLNQTEQEIWNALSERADLESRLKSAEQKLITPGARWALTLAALTPAQPDIPLLKKANELLDRFEKE